MINNRTNALRLSKVVNYIRSSQYKLTRGDLLDFCIQENLLDILLNFEHYVLSFLDEHNNSLED